MNHSGCRRRHRCGSGEPDGRGPPTVTAHVSPAVVQTVAMRHRHTLAAIAVLGIVAVPAAPISAASTDDTLPPGFSYVADDTATIVVAVPDAWTDRDTEPAFEEDGTVIPWIEVAPDRSSFRQTFDTPGITFWAERHTDDHQGLIDNYGLNGGCRSLTVEPYDDTVFVGLQQIGTDCGADGAATWKMIAASPADQAFSVVVHLQTAGPEDEEAIGWARYTFNRIDDIDFNPADAGAPAASGVPLGDKPAGGEPAGELSGVTVGPAANIVGYPDDVIAVTSEDGDITVEVPAAWNVVNYEILENGNGYLTATTDPDGFFTDGAAGRTAPGVRIMVNPTATTETDSTAHFLSGAFSIDCARGEALPVSLSNGFEGHAVAITDCADSDVLRNVVVARGASGVTLVVITQTMSADDPALDLVLASATTPR